MLRRSSANDASVGDGSSDAAVGRCSPIQRRLSGGGEAAKAEMGRDLSRRGSAEGDECQGHAQVLGSPFAGSPTHRRKHGISHTQSQQNLSQAHLQQRSSEGGADARGVFVRKGSLESDQGDQNREVPAKDASSPLPILRRNSSEPDLARYSP